MGPEDWRWHQKRGGFSPPNDDWYNNHDGKGSPIMSYSRETLMRGLEVGPRQVLEIEKHCKMLISDGDLEYSDAANDKFGKNSFGVCDDLRERFPEHFKKTKSTDGVEVPRWWVYHLLGLLVQHFLIKTREDPKMLRHGVRLVDGPWPEPESLPDIKQSPEPSIMMAELVLLNATKDAEGATTIDIFDSSAMKLQALAAAVSPGAKTLTSTMPLEADVRRFLGRINPEKIYSFMRISEPECSYHPEQHLLRWSYLDWKDDVIYQVIGQDNNMGDALRALWQPKPGFHGRLIFEFVSSSLPSVIMAALGD